MPLVDSNKRQRLHGLYVITDTGLIPPGQLTERVERALEGGARIVQYRDKGTEHDRREREARDLRQLCNRFGAALLINDDVTLARTVGADGVHLGREDPGVAQARHILGPQAIIGVSCYDALQRAVEAEQQGADYVAFGSFFPSPTKPRAVRAPVELLQQAKAALSIPICAIGGIHANNAAPLIAAGADMLAVISDVFGVEDPRPAAAAFARLFGVASA